MHSCELLEDGFDAPVATAAELDRFVSCGNSFLVVDVCFQSNVFRWRSHLGPGFAGGQ